MKKTLAKNGRFGKEPNLDWLPHHKNLADAMAGNVAADALTADKFEKYSKETNPKAPHFHLL